MSKRKNLSSGIGNMDNQVPKKSSFAPSTPPPSKPRTKPKPKKKFSMDDAVEKEIRIIKRKNKTITIDEDLETKMVLIARNNGLTFSGMLDQILREYFEL